jgi:oligoendopeptidase F
VARTLHTDDEAAQNRFKDFLQQINEPAQAASNKLTVKLLESGLTPKGLEVPMRVLRADAELFREANLPLLTEHTRLGMEYDQIIGGQTVSGTGGSHDPGSCAGSGRDRATREQAWQCPSASFRREAINALGQLMDVRRQILERRKPITRCVDEPQSV